MKIVVCDDDALVYEQMKNIIASFSASTFWFLVYLSNQSYYLDRCVQPFLRILFSLGTPAKTLLKKCEMIHLRRLSGSLPVDSV